MCRLFTSMLQLVNGGNIAVLQPALGDAPLQLQLLSLERHHQQMFNFKAPSLHEKVRAWMELLFCPADITSGGLTYR